MFQLGLLIVPCESTIFNRENSDPRSVRWYILAIYIYAAPLLFRQINIDMKMNTINKTDPYIGIVVDTKQLV